MITKVTAQNLKGRSFSFPLQPLTIITGPNAHGKTSIADAITVGLFGYHPNLGKTNPATMQLASADRMEIALQMLGGQESKQAWTRKGKTIKKDGAPPEGVAPLLQSLLTGPQFLSASATQRAAMIRTAAGAGAEDPVQVLTQQIQASGKIAGLWGCLPKTKVTEFADWIEDRRDAIKDEITASRAVIDRMTKTMQGLAHLSTESQEHSVTLEQLTEARNKEAQAQAELATFNLTFERLKQERDKANRLAATPDAHPIEPTEAALAKMETLKQQIAAEAVIVANNDRDNREYLRLTRQRNALLDARDKTKHDLEEAMQSANLTVMDAEHFIETTPPPDLQTLHAACVEAYTATQATEVAVNRWTLEANDAAKTGECTHCQSCGAAREHWTPEIRNAAGEAHSTAQLNLNEAKARLAAAALAEKTANTANAKGQETAQTLLQANRIVELGKTLAQLNEDIEATPEPTPPAPPEEVGNTKYELENELTEYTEGLEAYDLGQKLQQAQTALEQHEANRAPLFDAAQEAAKTREQYQVAYDAAQASRNEAQKLGEAQKELDEAKEQADQWKALQELLLTLAADLARKSLEPILETARLFTDGLLPTPLGARGLELGRWDGDNFVALDVFSGSERAVAFAGISAALATGGKRLIILDEFSQLDDDRKTLFLEHLTAAIDQGRIDQAIVLDNRRPPVASPLYHIDLAEIPLALHA